MKLINKVVRKPKTCKYPWDVILDGKARRVERGIDYFVRSDSFRCLARHMASVRGMRVVTSMTKDYVEIQAMQVAEPGKKNKPASGRKRKS